MKKYLGKGRGTPSRGIGIQGSPGGESGGGKVGGGQYGSCSGWEYPSPGNGN